MRWNPEDAIAELALECDAMDLGDPVDTAQTLLKDAAPAAARSITFLAVHSRDEKTRLRAARYIIDKVTENRLVDDPFEESLRRMYQDTDSGSA